MKKQHSRAKTKYIRTKERQQCGKQSIFTQSDGTARAVPSLYIFR